MNQQVSFFKIVFKKTEPKQNKIKIESLIQELVLWLRMFFTQSFYLSLNLQNLYKILGVAKLPLMVSGVETEDYANQLQFYRKPIKLNKKELDIVSCIISLHTHTVIFILQIYVFLILCPPPYPLSIFLFFLLLFCWKLTLGL